MTDPIVQATDQFYFKQEQVDKAFEERQKRRDQYILEQITGPTRNLDENREIFFNLVRQYEPLEGEDEHKAVKTLYAAFQAYLATDIDQNAQFLAKAFKGYIDATIGNIFDLEGE